MQKMANVCFGSRKLPKGLPRCDGLQSVVSRRFMLRVTNVRFGTEGDIGAGMQRMAAFESEADVIWPPGSAFQASPNRPQRSLAKSAWYAKTL